MVSEVHIWIHGGQSPAQFQHLMHLPNVDATFQQLMHIPIVDAFSVAIPTSWCHIPTVDVIFSHIPTIDAISNCGCTFLSEFQQVDALSNCWWYFQSQFQHIDANSNKLMQIPTRWCKFQHVDANSNKLMHIPTVDAYFLSINKFCLIFPQKKGTKLILTTTKDCQSWTCWCTFQQFDVIFILLLCYIPTSWCTFQLLIPFLLCNITAVDAPVPTVDASFILSLKLLFC